MPLLFSYGTLQRAEVQLSTFGRLLPGERDELPEFELTSIPVKDPDVTAEMGITHYANVVSSKSMDSRVSGTVFEVTEAELIAADEYERDATYERRSVMLASGKKAWVYLSRGS